MFNDDYAVSGDGLGDEGLGDAYDAVVRQLSGDGSDGEGDIGDEEADLVSALSGDIGAARRVARRVAKKRGLSIPGLARRLNSVNQGYQLLSPDVSGPEAFQRSGSICLASFTGTVTASSTLVVAVTLDRKSTLREMRCDSISSDLRVAAFTAGGLPYAALQFPFSLGSFSPIAKDRKIQAMTFGPSTRLSLTLSNPTLADISALVEIWGVAS